MEENVPKDSPFLIAGILRQKRKTTGLSVEEVVAKLE